MTGSPEDYALMLSSFLGVPLQQILSQDRQVWAWFYNDKGRLNFVDVHDEPKQGISKSQLMDLVISNLKT